MKKWLKYRKSAIKDDKNILLEMEDIIYETRKNVGLGRRLRKCDILAFFVNDIENLKCFWEMYIYIRNIGLLCMRGDGNVDILLMMWLAIDMVLLIILPLRKNVMKNENVMRGRSIESVKSLSDRLMDAFSKILLLIPVGLVIYVVIYFIPDVVIQKLLEWYKGIFIVVLFPLFFSWIKEKNFNIKSIWNGCLTVLAVLFSIAGYIIDIEYIKTVSEYRVALNVLMTMLVTIFFVAVLEIRKASKEYYSNKLPKKDIRKDLYYRTPGLMVNVSDVELIKCCEKYFNEYLCRYRKIKELRSIEYVYLAGVHRELWYKKAARFMKILVVLSIFAIIINLIFDISYKSFWIIGFLILFWILVVIYKHKDLKFLHIVGIRYFYDEWGYYLTCTNRNKFVGTVQMIESSKFHKYIHSFLDIVALCRAVAFSDKMNAEKKICIITSNLSELFVNYSDYMENQNWVMVIPLWTAALFEFYVTGKINDETKTALLKSADESVRADISIFLQSFWADIERRKLEDGILEYIQLFEKKIYD